MLDIFVAVPLLALGPALLFLALYWRMRRRPPLVAAVAWVLYWLYEEGMRHRVLCSGECNIRVDLLVIYPVLLLISLAALLSWGRWLRERPPSAE